MKWISTHFKPLSVNEAYQGRKVKSAKYRQYENVLLNTLPDYEIPEGNLHLRLLVSYSSKRSDIDNCLKPFIDVLQKRYDFNDNRIYRITVKKEIVPKGEEGITFNLERYEIKK